MNITIENYKNDISINIGNISQFLGTDFKTKNNIINFISKYFSKSKNSEYEKEKNLLYNGEKLGREYFDIININTKEEISEKFKLAKNSLFRIYISKILENYDNQKSLNIIDEELIKIYEDINEYISKDFNNMILDYDIENLLEIVSNSNITDKD